MTLLAEPTLTAPRDPAVRGRLVVGRRAVSRTVQRAAEETSFGARDVTVDVGAVDEEGVAVGVTLGARYPETALAPALSEFRRELAAEVERILGRRVLRLDVDVVELFAETPAPLVR